MAKKRSTKSKSKFRASWRGMVRFGLVAFPAQAINALDRSGSDIHFHQLHQPCHNRIHYAKVCPVHGEVPNDEIVSGYEQKKGKYVEIDPEELDAVRTDAERAMTIDTFVDPETIDPIYYDGRMYYLVPDGPGANESYAVITAAMEKKGRYGVGQVVFSGKEQLALVRPVEGLLHLAMLNFHAEIRPPEEVAAVIRRPTGMQRKVQLALTLIEQWTTRKFEFADYEDTYREKLQDLIDAKVHGREVVAPEEDEEPDVVNLLDALKKSVAAATAKGPSGGKRRKRRRA